MGKNGKSTKHRKTRDFLAGGERSAAGGAAPLSYGEERNAFGKDTARGPLAGLLLSSSMMMMLLVMLLLMLLLMLLTSLMLSMWLMWLMLLSFVLSWS